MEGRENPEQVGYLEKGRHVVTWSSATGQEGAIGLRLIDANTMDLFVYIERRVGDSFIPER